MRRSMLAAVFVVSFVAVTVGPDALAQAGGGWDPADIRKMSKAYLEALPTSKMKVKGVTLEYRKVPGDPKAVAEEVADEEWKGMINAMAEQVKAQLVSFLEEAGTLETKRTITYKHRKEETELPPGEYEFGIYMEEGVPKYAGIFGEGLDEPLRLPLKIKKKVREPQTLQLKSKLKNDKLELTLAYGHHVARLPTLLLGEIGAAGDGESEGEGEGEGGSKGDGESKGEGESGGTGGTGGTESGGTGKGADR